MNKIAEIDCMIAKYAPNEYPCLLKQYEEFEASKPLDGLRVLDATPIYRNTLLKYKALLLAGAKLSVGVTELFQYDPEILNFLRSAEIEIVDKTRTADFDIVLDNAAAFRHMPSRFGYVELTRSGVEKYKQANVPVYLADSGIIKRIETCLGTGESCFRALEHFGYSDFAGKNLVLFGGGKVGTGIIYYGKKNNLNITVVTEIAKSRICNESGIKWLDLKDTDEIVRAVKTADFVVSATGIKNAVADVCPPEEITWSYAVVLNMGVEDEYGKDVKPSRVLNGKKTANFVLDEPTKVCFIEATMALHNYGAVYMVQNSPSGIILPSAELEDRLIEESRSAGVLGDSLGYII